MVYNLIPIECKEGKNLVVVILILHTLDRATCINCIAFVITTTMMKIKICEKENVSNSPDHKPPQLKFFLEQKLLQLKLFENSNYKVF